jgi:hypothetical protein
MKKKRPVDYLLAIRKKTCKAGSTIQPDKGGKYKRNKRINELD